MFKFAGPGSEILLVLTVFFPALPASPVASNTFQRQQRLYTHDAHMPPLPLHRPPIPLPLTPAMNVKWRSWPSPCLCPTPSSTTPKGGSVLFFPHGGETFLCFLPES